ncbi:AAA-like domain-containing protein [Aerosakkonema sp. BLCC-F183]|uniref:AAA-like domain-containing protein n=1 Tax=Aerosakkonema sp. BLCC-F183 TaxID=3342834 RepID=UPI0035B7E60B
MTIDEVIELIRAKFQKELNPVQEMVLREVWQGETYSKIASASHYGEHYLRNTASSLWQLLSGIFNTTITKANFRSTLESRSLSADEQQLIAEFSCKQALATPLEFPSGPVPIASPFYIERPPIEELAYQEIVKPGSIIRIKAPRKMGKSSLMLRILERAVSTGYRSVTLDFQQAEEAVFENLDKFLRWFCANVSRQLQLKSLLDDYWDEDMGSKVSCTIYFQAYLLKETDSPLVLALNEVNALFEYPKIAQEFLPLLRSWYEESKRIDSLKKLRLIVLHSTEIYVPLKLSQSPFNIGLPLELPDFTKAQVIALARLHGLNWTDGPEADRLLAMVGGHPYLVRLALYQMAQGNLTLDRLLQEAPTIGGIYKDHLRSLWAILQEHPELLAALKQVVVAQGKVQLEPILAYKLDSMGLVQLDGNECSFSCELYRQYFSSQNLG